MCAVKFQLRAGLYVAQYCLRSCASFVSTVYLLRYFVYYVVRIVIQSIFLSFLLYCLVKVFGRKSLMLAMLPL